MPTTLSERRVGYGAVQTKIEKKRRGRQSIGKNGKVRGGVPVQVPYTSDSVKKLSRGGSFFSKTSPHKKALCWRKKDGKGKNPTPRRLNLRQEGEKITEYRGSKRVGE